MNCTIHAIACFFECQGVFGNHSFKGLVEHVKREFDYDNRPILDDGRITPPSMHEIIDYFMSIGYALTPIARCPEYKFPDGTIGIVDGAEERWFDYLNDCEGFLMGTAYGVHHMAYNDHGMVFDCREGCTSYDVAQAASYGFSPDMFMVITCQA